LKTGKVAGRDKTKGNVFQILLEEITLLLYNTVGSIQFTKMSCTIQNKRGRSLCKVPTKINDKYLFPTKINDKYL
jgi:hypothetical protein